MRKIWISILTLLALLVILPLHGSWRKTQAFLATAVSCDLSDTQTNGTEFTSLERQIYFPANQVTSTVLITVTFTRTTGTSSEVYFEFQGCFDADPDTESNWTTTYLFRIEVATNATAVSDVVRYSELVNCYGVSHLRLYRIVNNDASTNLTLCNAYVSF